MFQGRRDEQGKSDLEATQWENASRRLDREGTRARRGQRVRGGDVQRLLSEYGSEGDINKSRGKRHYRDYRWPVRYLEFYTMTTSMQEREEVGDVQDVLPECGSHRNMKKNRSDRVAQLLFGLLMAPSCQEYST